MPEFKKVINTTIPGSQPQIDSNTTVTASHTTSIAVGDQLHVSGSNYSNNEPTAGNSIDNIYKVLADNALITAITTGRTVTFNNNTASTNLDLYLTVGGSNPLPIALVTTINASASHVWDIPDTPYNWNGNFTTMPAGSAVPKFNAGPTIAEFGFNQVWHGFVPELRDTFDISTVPAGIGTNANNGPRSLVVSLSRAAGFSVQQSFNYNVGVSIVPPAGVLSTETVTCNVTNGDSAGSIGFPNDTAFPKQQTGGALGNYIVNFIDPVVTVP
uniref:Uncharacterized protein n=1 Tax=Marseillevirus LCMAC201 TaxID=2506605 RepID=A0A481YX26_9VIRU|nr:MAG: hypothetical protein LCMAC201_04930 [Marseillevirus LCMAC201]